MIFGKKEKEDMAEKRDEIQGLGLGAIKKYFGINPAKLNKLVLEHLFKQAKIGMQFEREQNVNKRTVESNYIRVFKAIAENKKDFKELLQGKMPHYLPEENKTPQP